MQGTLDGKKKWMKEEKKERKNERMKKKKEEEKKGKKKNGCPLRPPQATSINTPAGCITNNAISCYGQKHTLRRLACFQWLQVGVEGNQVEGRKEEGIKGEKES